MDNTAYDRLLADVTQFLSEIRHLSVNEIQARKHDGLRLIERYNRLKATTELPPDDKLTDLMLAEMPWARDEGQG